MASCDSYQKKHPLIVRERVSYREARSEIPLRDKQQEGREGEQERQDYSRRQGQMHRLRLRRQRSIEEDQSDGQMTRQK